MQRPRSRADPPRSSSRARACPGYVLLDLEDVSLGGRGAVRSLFTYRLKGFPIIVDQWLIVDRGWAWWLSGGTDTVGFCEETPLLGSDGGDAGAARPRFLQPRDRGPARRGFRSGTKSSHRRRRQKAGWSGDDMVVLPMTRRAARSLRPAWSAAHNAVAMSGGLAADGLGDLWTRSETTRGRSVGRSPRPVPDARSCRPARATGHRSAS